MIRKRLLLTHNKFKQYIHYSFTTADFIELYCQLVGGLSQDKRIKLPQENYPMLVIGIVLSEEISLFVTKVFNLK